MYRCDVCGIEEFADNIGKAIMTIHAREHDEADRRRTDQDSKRSLGESQA